MSLTDTSHDPYEGEEEYADRVIGDLQRHERDPESTLYEMLERLDADPQDWAAWTVLSEIVLEEPGYEEYVAPYRAGMSDDMPARIVRAALRYTRANYFVYDAELSGTHGATSGLTLAFRDGTFAVWNGNRWCERLTSPHAKDPSTP